MTGAREGVTASEAHAAWASYRLWPRMLRDVSAVATSTTLLGTTYGIPLGVAPTSLQRCADPEGERAMARATRTAGAPHVVSSNAGFPFAAIAAVGGPWWLQAYLTTDRAACLPMLEAAVAAGAEAVVLTVDTPFPGTKYGVADADWVGVDLSWHRCNYPSGTAAGQRGDWARDVGPEDLAWLAEQTGVPVVVKGILRPDDADTCVQAGAAAVWVSNHGGRQLDRSVATAHVLPTVVEAVDGRAEVYVDGGVGSGIDLVTALALGADAAFVGRLPWLALAAGGESEVRAVLGRLTEELVETMRLAGSADPASCRGLTGPAEGPSEARIGR
ncbi:alpha-hydroxy acid oxidase [Nocardioides terrisoli]|uniref:alpha-hydroxy acid oxidase n=1 Tax=Nocardioides terrisoli TaxID=3388267 RepID=UPI0037CADAD1